MLSSLSEKHDEAGKIIKAKLYELEKNSKLYIHILKAVAMGFDRWKSIKNAVKLWENREIPNAQISRLLKN